VDGHGKPLTSFEYDEIDFTDKHTARMYKWGEDDQSANVSTYDLQTGITTTIPVSLVFGLSMEDHRNSDLNDYMGFEQDGKYGCYSLKEKKITVPAKSE